MKSLDILCRYGVAFLTLLVIWQFGAWLLGPFLLPAPTDVLPIWLHGFFQPDIWIHIQKSTFRVVLALILAWVVSFPLGIFLGYRRCFDRYLSPIIFLTYPLPKIVLLPVFLTLFGLGDLSKILLIALTAGYQILVVTRDSIRHLDARYRYAFRTLSESSLQLVRHVLVPSALPDALTALKVASGTSVAVLFMAESFATQHGLGFFIMDAWGRGDQIEMFCGILSMSLLGILVYECCHIAEKVLCRWKKLENRRDERA
jgi:NitT/TauT family transport system permease protein